MNESLGRLLHTAGRWLVAAFFILAGLAKIGDYSTYLGMMDEAGLAPTAVLLPATILVEVGGGLLLGFGRKWAWQAGLVLALFTLGVNVFLHDFWAVGEDMRQIQLSLFVKNAAIVGALLVLAADCAQANRLTPAKA